METYHDDQNFTKMRNITYIGDLHGKTYRTL